MRIFLCINHLRTSAHFYYPTVSLAGNTLTINIFLIILGSKSAEDFQQLSNSQVFIDQRFLCGPYNPRALAWSQRASMSARVMSESLRPLRRVSCST